MSKNKKLLSSEMLEQKNLLPIRNVLVASFEFMLAGICKEYCDAKSITTIKDFNELNNLSYYRALVYPFFVSISNGNSKSLYSLFGDFYTLSFGPASMNLYDLIESNERNVDLHYFDMKSNVNTIGIKVKDESQDNFLKIKEKIKKEIIHFDGAEKYQFEHIDILDDNENEKPLYSAIENGIDVIRQQSNKSFFLADERRIISQAQNFKAFQRAYIENKYSILSYDQIKDDKAKRFKEEQSLIPA